MPHRADGASRPDSPDSKFLEKIRRRINFCLSVEMSATAPGFAKNGARVLGEGREQRNVHGDASPSCIPGIFCALVELEEARRKAEVGSERK